MTAWLELCLVFLVLTNFVMLGSSRLSVLIRMVTVQGIILSAMPLLVAEAGVSIRQGLLAAGFFGIKGIVFPHLLRKAQRMAEVRHEVEPFISYNFSLLLGVGALAFAFWLGKRLPLPTQALSELLVPFAMFTFL